MPIWLGTPAGDDHPRLEFKRAGHIVLVAHQRLLEALAGNARGEVERPAPSVLEEVRNQVVIEVVDLLLFALFGLGAGALVGPEAALVVANGRGDAGRAQLLPQGLGDNGLASTVYPQFGLFLQRVLVTP